MKRIGFSVFILALAVMATAHAAAPATCSPSTSPVQRLYCAHPALAAMDRSVQALAAASNRPRARRDQRHWQAQRDDALWRLLSDRASGTDAVLREAWSLERSRQAFLLGKVGQGAVPWAPMTRMAKVLRAHRHAAGAPLAVWARFDPGVKLAQTLRSQPNDLGKALGRIALSPDAALAERIEQTSFGYPWLDVMWLPQARLGAVVSVQGSAHCQVATWFRADREGVAHAIAAPMLDQAPCEHAQLVLLRVGVDTYVALQSTHGPYAVDVSVQQWLDGRWASPLRQRLRYDHAVRLSQLRCTDATCAPYADAVVGLARRYDASPQGSQVAGARIKPAELARARELLRLARRDRKTLAGSMPMAGSEAMTTFCSDASFVLLRVGGRLLLGRIGHGYLGWRRSDGWRVGLWDLRGGALTPVAGAVIQRPRGRLLAMATMPPAVIPTH